MENIGNIMFWVIGLVMVCFLAWVLRPRWNRTPKRQSRVYSGPIRVSDQVPTPVRVPTLADKIKTQILRAGLYQRGTFISVKSLYRMLRQSGYNDPLKPQNIQAILDQQSRRGVISRRRPRRGSARHRRNATTYSLA